ncbi:MAG: DUF2085 domain-containing protein [Spirochaetaceae bacterium]|nr:DUF2085 domain-containing protein [Spirochaetaceae bacterium]
MVYAEWAKGKQRPIFSGFVIAVGKNLNNRTRIWVKLMKIGASTGCHQFRERSFSIFGYQFPVCARCTGLGIGQFLGFIFSFALLKYNILILFFTAIFFLILLGIDGLGQLKQKWESKNHRRLFTGLLYGFFNIVFLIKAIIELYKLIAKYNGT